MEHIILIEKYISVLLESKIHSLIIKSAPGLGKTTAVLDTVKRMGLVEGRHFMFYTGYMTPLKMYEALLMSRTLENPKLLIFDDLDNLIKNKTSLALLKGALSEARGKRVVSYESNLKSIETKSFDFEGKVIMIINDINISKDLEPLFDRGIFYNVEVDKDLLTKHIETDVLNKYDSVQPKERLAVWIKIKRFVQYPNFSLRMLDKAFQFYKHDKENWYNMFMKIINIKK